MKLSDFDYSLPDELIARFPLAERAASRLLCVDGGTGELSHDQFRDLVRLLREGDLLVFNDTRVIPARLFGRKESGGQVEILVERIRGEFSVVAHVRASKSPKPGSRLLLGDSDVAVMVGREQDLFVLEFSAPVRDVLDRLGEMPLPPYFSRRPELSDRDRYQTVYAREEGSVAAPTAGLHFDQALLDALSAAGVRQARVTLHVGAGTFQPVRAEDIRDHRMHSEWLRVSPETAAAVNEARRRGGRVVAVGTTSVRSLETAARFSQGGELQAYEGETDIFIYPGYHWQVVDALVTNFHLPQSSLLMLVSAFAGYDTVMEAYRQAVAAQYRFFSYGDAMFLTRKPEMQK